MIFECQATGFPVPTLFWTIEGNRSLIFPGNRLNNIEASTTVDGRNILSISNIDRTDNGMVIGKSLIILVNQFSFKLIFLLYLVCSSVNPVGSVSTRVVLSVNIQDESPPPIIIQGPINQTLPIKSVASLPCRAIGKPKPTISW